MVFNSTKGRNLISGAAMAAGASPRERIAGPAYCASAGSAPPASINTRRNFNRPPCGGRIRDKSANSRGKSKCDAPPHACQAFLDPPDPHLAIHDLTDDCIVATFAWVSRGV